MNIPEIQIKEHIVKLTPKVREALGLSPFESIDPRTFMVLHFEGFNNQELFFEAKEIVATKKDAD